MEINFAHIREQGIDCIVFDADAAAGTDQARSHLLAELVERCRGLGLHIQKAALAFRRGGRVQFFGARDLVRMLANRGVPRWTNTLRT